MGRRLRSAVRLYGIPVLTAAAALLATVAFRTFLEPSIYLLFFAAVTLSAWCGGLRAGLLATVLSLISIAFFLLTPVFPLAIGGAVNTARLVVFAAIAGTISILSDVRLREAQTRQQLETERRFRALVDAAPDAIQVFDRDGRIVLVNSEVERLYGYTRAELMGQDIDLLIPQYRRAASRAYRAAIFAAQLAGRINGPPEMAGQRRDGSIFPVEITFSPLETPGGLLLIAAVRDVTEPRHTQEQLRRQQQQLADAQQIASLGSWEWDVAANRVGWSDEMRRIYGMPPDGFDGSYDSFLGQVHPEDRDLVDGVVRRAFEQGDTFQFEHRIVRPDGEVRVLHARGEAVRDEARQVVRMVGTGQDITERKRADEEHDRLVREQAALAAAQENQRRLLFLTEASAILSSSLEYEHTLQSLAELTVPVLADWCVVHVLTAGGELRPLAVAHADPLLVQRLRELQAQFPVSLDRDAGVSHVLRTGQTTFLTEVVPERLAQSGFASAYMSALLDMGMHSVIIVALTARGRNLGTISLVRRTGNDAYTPDDRLLAEALARRAAIAVDNALLYQDEQRARASAQAAEAQLQRHAASLQALADASRDFSTGVPHFQELLDTIVRRTSEATGDLCTLRLLSEDGQQLLPAASWHRDPELLQATRDQMAATREPYRGRWRELLQARSMSIFGVEAPLPEQTPEQAAYVRRFRPQSTMIAPLHARGRLLGSLALVRNDRGPEFTEAEQALVRDLAERAALAIDNARLYREAEDQRQRLHTALEQIPFGITLVEAPDGRISFRNAAARQFSEWLTGGSPAGTVSGSYQAGRYLGADGTPLLLEELPPVRVLRTGEPVHDMEIVCKRDDGERLTILTSAVPIEDADGNVTAAAAVFQDITARKTLDQQKDEFLSLAAHELKTPLTVVKGNSQLLQRLLARGTATPDQLTQYLQRIEQRVRYMEELISELLDLSRIVSGRLEFHPEPTNLAELVQHAVAQQEELHPEMVYTVAGAALTVVGEWDRGRIEQVLTNLLDNAAKYSAPHGTVTVALAVSRLEVEVAVTDRGIGIPAADLPHIFERHYRAGNVDRGHSGLGLGLYLSRQIVQRHGGRLWVESVAGRGSTFHLALPLLHGEKEA